MINSKMTDLRPRAVKYSRQVRLVSGGYTNRAAFPNGMITVYPWDSEVDNWLVEEANKTTPTEEATVLYRAVERLCNLNGCPLEDFPVGDVFTVLLVARSIQHECTIQYQPVCPHCRFEHLTKLKVPDDLEQLGRKADDYAGTDKITLPVCGDVVTLRPLVVGDMFKILGRDETARTAISNSLAQTLSHIVSINDSTADTAKELMTWYYALPPKDCAFLVEQEGELTPQLNMVQYHECDRCKKKFEHELQIDRNFFRTGHFTKH